MVDPRHKNFLQKVCQKFKKIEIEAQFSCSAFHSAIRVHRGDSDQPKTSLDLLPLYQGNEFPIPAIIGIHLHFPDSLVGGNFSIGFCEIL
jgi:hypothetical protein